MKVKITNQKRKAIDTKSYDGKKDIAVVLIRGLVRVNPKLKDTLKMLNLERKHSCVIVKNTKEIMGMVVKVKDFTTFGEINKETLGLLDKKGKTVKKNQKVVYHLSPPLHGFERKGIKKHFNEGGALGYRGEYINDLISRMM